MSASCVITQATEDLQAWRVLQGGFLEPFKSVGITPPRGRQGHSVPTPRPLQGSKLVHVAGRIQGQRSGMIGKRIVCARYYNVVSNNTAQ